MTDIQDLIKRAEEALKDLPPTPWKAHEWSMDDANRYEVIADMDGVSDQVRNLIQEAPVLIRELVDALKEAVASAEEWKGWAEYHKDWSEYRAQEWDEARKKYPELEE